MSSSTLQAALLVAGILWLVSIRYPEGIIRRNDPSWIKRGINQIGGLIAAPLVLMFYMFLRDFSPSIIFVTGFLLYVLGYVLYHQERKERDS